MGLVPTTRRGCTHLLPLLITVILRRLVPLGSRGLFLVEVELVVVAVLEVSVRRQEVDEAKAKVEDKCLLALVEFISSPVKS